MGLNLKTFDQNFSNFLFKQGVVVPAVGEVNLVLKAGTTTEEYWGARVLPEYTHATIAEANSNLESLRNDVVIITGESHSLDASLTVSANEVHYVGASMGGMFARSRIGMSTAFTPMITVSGYGNSFHNLYTMHGTAAGDYMGWRITGHRNKFYNCHFAGPLNAAQGGHASYEGMSIEGTGNEFHNCIFGTDSVARDEITPNVTLAAGSNTIFKDCYFDCQLTDGDPIFVKVENNTTTIARFQNCMFTAMNPNWATAMTVAFTFSAGATAGIYLDNNCNFVNVSALCAADKDQFIWLPRAHATTTDTQGCISVQLSI